MCASQDTRVDREPSGPSEAFAELGRIRLRDNDLPKVLSRVVEIAKDRFPAVEEASITLIRDGLAHTASFTAPLALELDVAQYEAGSGPCMQAASAGVSVSVSDMADEARWPDFTRVAISSGALSSLSIGLALDEEVKGAINMYATTEHAFDEEATSSAESFAHVASVAIANILLYESSLLLASQMQSAMESRAVIEQAKGILIGERGCDPDEAFRILAKVSQDSNRKLRDVAQALVDKARAIEDPASPTR